MIRTTIGYLPSSTISLLIFCWHGLVRLIGYQDLEFRTFTSKCRVLALINLLVLKKVVWPDLGNLPLIAPSVSRCCAILNDSSDVASI